MRPIDLIDFFFDDGYPGGQSKKLGDLTVTIKSSGDSSRQVRDAVRELKANLAAVTGKSEQDPFDTVSEQLMKTARRIEAEKKAIDAGKPDGSEYSKDEQLRILAAASKTRRPIAGSGWINFSRPKPCRICGMPYIHNREDQLCNKCSPYSQERRTPPE